MILAVQLVTFGLLAEMVTSFFFERRNEYPVVDTIGFDRDPFHHRTSPRDDVEQATVE